MVGGCSCLHAQFMLWTFWYIPDIPTSHLVEQFDLAVGIVPYYGGSSVLNQCRSREGKNKSATSLGNTIIIIGFASSYTAQLDYFLHMVELLCF